MFRYQDLQYEQRVNVVHGTANTNACNFESLDDRWLHSNGLLALISPSSIESHNDDFFFFENVRSILVPPERTILVIWSNEWN